MMMVFLQATKLIKNSIFKALKQKNIRQSAVLCFFSTCMVDLTYDDNEFKISFREI